MTDYLASPLEDGPTATELAQRSVDYMTANVPGWSAELGSYESFLFDAAARATVDVRDVAAAVPKLFFAAFGATVVGLPPVEAIAASSTSTWTMIDDTGYTIPAGTQVGIPGPGGIVPFTVEASVVVAPGSTATAAGEVSLVAVDAGSDASGLDATPVLIDALAYVESIELVAATSGGQDAETIGEYSDRLARRFRTLSDTLILPEEVAIVAQDVDGVHRALAIDGYDPDTETDDNERTVAVALVDDNGAAVSSGVQDAVEAALEELREVNFVFKPMDPTFTAVTITATLVTYPGWETSDVDTRATAALTDFLSPATWGELPYGESPTWVDRTTLRRFDVVRVLGNVDGVDHVSDLTINGSGSDDLDLGDRAAMPAAAPTLTITVNAP